MAAVQRWSGTTVQADSGSLASLQLQLIAISRWIIFSHLHGGESSTSSGGDGVKTATATEDVAAVAVGAAVVVVEEK